MQTDKGAEFRVSDKDNDRMPALIITREAYDTMTEDEAQRHIKQMITRYADWKKRKADKNK